MPPFLYRCPNTGKRVQGFTAEEVSDEDAETFVTVTCVMCNQLHLVNPATGKVAGIDDEYSASVGGGGAVLAPFRQMENEWPLLADNRRPHLRVGRASNVHRELK